MFNETPPGGAFVVISLSPRQGIDYDPHPHHRVRCASRLREPGQFGNTRLLNIGISQHRLKA
jgi:hypothetical protein